MKTKLCIFDLDGTLTDSLRDLADSMNYAIQKHGFAPRPTGEYRYMVGNGISVLADRAAGLDKNSNPDVKRKILEDFGEYYELHKLDNTRPFDGMSELIRKLKELGIKLAVNSNKNDNFTYDIVTTLFGKDCFSDIRGKRDGVNAKPDPSAALSIIENAGVKKEECIYIGDSNVDIRTAKNAGIKSIGVCWGFRTKEELMQEGADYIAEIPEDILKFI